MNRYQGIHTKSDMKVFFTKDKLKDFFSIKDLKDFFSKSKGLFYLLLGFLILFFSFYACNFSGGLSSEHDKWSQFGDFFNGVISPIFAAINICIFWYLTKVIDLNNDKRQEEMLNKEKELQKEMQDYEDKRQQQIEENENKRQREIEENEDKRQQQIEENENKRQQQIQDNEDRRQRERLEHEKTIMLMQFRKAEIDRFEEAVTDKMLINLGKNDDSLLMFASAYILSFLNTKLELFDLDKNSSTAVQIHTLGTTINDFQILINASNLDAKTINGSMMNILQMKYSILSSLRKITLGK